LSWDGNNFFSIKNKKSFYIKISEWSNTQHLLRTPGNIWKLASKRGFYDIPKLRISSAAIKLARNIGKQFTDTTLFLSSVQEEKEIEDDEDGGSTNSSKKFRR
jgi:hypothetical protein